MAFFRPPTTPEDADIFRLRGRHSDIPECCINWFIIVRKRIPVWFLDARLKIYIWLEIDRPNYARCVLCTIRKRVVIIHECDEICHGQAGHCRSYNCSLCKEQRQRR